MNIKHALLHNTGWKVIAMIFTFINNIVIVHLLGIADSASFFYTLAALTLISTFMRLGLENGIIYVAAKDEKKIASLVLFASILIFIQIVVCYFLLKYLFQIKSSYSLIYALFFTIGNVLIYYITAFYQVKKMYASINIVNTIITIFQTVTLLYLYFVNTNLFIITGYAKSMNDTILFVLSVGLFFQTIFLVCYFYTIHKKDFSILRLDAPTYKLVCRYSSINFLSTVIMFLVMRIDFYFVEKYCTIVELGNYVQVAKIGQMALIFPGLIGGVVFPFSVNATHAFADKISFFCRLITLVFALLFIGFLFTGKYIFVWLLGADYNLMYAGLAATFVGVYCLAISMVLIAYFEGKNSQTIILIACSCTLAIVVIADAFFVPHFGYMAAAIIFSFANIVGMTIYLFYFKNKTRKQLKHIFLFTKNDLAIFTFKKLTP